MVAHSRKLPKAERRDQLLETAQRIVREQGTDALTLGHLAECAGVSKPIAYEHFGTRSGLLVALYRRIDDLQIAALIDALERTPRRLAEVAQVIAQAFMDCTMQVGQEWHAISAALMGDGETEAFQQAVIDRYVDLYEETLAPYADAPAEALRLRCIGILGAADAIAREMGRGRVAEPAAVEALAGLIVASLAQCR